MRKKILVIGATGNIGSNLVKLLAKNGDLVKAATRNPESYVAQPNIEPVAFDYDKPETYEPALRGMDRAFVIARSGDPESDKVINPLIDKAKAAGLKHIVLLTSMGANQVETSPLYKAEQHLMASGIDYTILRPNWFMQNFSRGFILPTIQQSDGIYLPVGEGKTSFIDTRDIAAVAAKSLTENGRHAGQAYPLTGGQSLSYAETARIISNVAGRPIQYVAISDDDLRKNLAEAGWPPGQIEFMVAIFQPVKHGLAAAIDPTLASLLGREPISFEQFARENADVWK